jgi:hypothetical protein
MLETHTDQDDEAEREAFAQSVLEAQRAQVVYPKRKRGRPRKKERSVSPRQLRRDVIEIAEMKTTIQTAEGPKEVTLAQAMLWVTAKKAIDGHGPSLRFFLTLFGKMLIEHAAANPKVFEFLEFMETETFAHPRHTSTAGHTDYLNDFRRGTGWV